MMVKQDTLAEIVCVVRKSWRIRRKDAAHPYQWLLPKLRTKRRTPGLGGDLHASMYVRDGWEVRKFTNQIEGIRAPSRK